jgi:hypothetical protein
LIFENKQIAQDCFSLLYLQASSVTGNQAEKDKIKKLLLEILTDIFQYKLVDFSKEGSVSEQRVIRSIQKIENLIYTEC